MQKFNFDFMKAGEPDPIRKVSGLMLDLSQAKAHCRNLYEGIAPSVGADSVRVRENDGNRVLFSWPGESRHSGQTKSWSPIWLVSVLLLPLPDETSGAKWTLRRF